MTRIKERVVWDYYYIEIVKCYLCLALNHQSGDLIGTMFETWKLWGACDVCECERRINAFVVQTIGHYFRACSYSLCQVQRLNSENGDLSTVLRRGNQMLRLRGSPHNTPFDLIKEKNFSSHSRVSVYFLWTKKPKAWHGSNHSIFRKMVFYKQV